MNKGNSDSKTNDAHKDHEHDDWDYCVVFRDFQGGEGHVPESTDANWAKPPNEGGLLEGVEGRQVLVHEENEWESAKEED